MKRRRYKRIAPPNAINGGSEHYNRFSVTVSDELYYDLIRIKDKLNVSLPELTTNMIIMELENVFEDWQKELSHKRKEIQKVELRDKIPLSNVFKMRIDTIAEKIGIPRNALMAQIIAEYLIDNYIEFDNNFYGDSKGKDYHGVW